MVSFVYLLLYGQVQYLMLPIVLDESFISQITFSSILIFSFNSLGSQLMQTTLPTGLKLNFSQKMFCKTSLP
jgi:hypothetical protein